MGSVWMVCGGKGGVGKTATTLALVHMLRAAGRKIAVVDADTTNPGTYKAHTDSAGAPVGCDLVDAIDLSTPDGWCALVGLCEDMRGHDIVVDMPAGMGAPVAENAPTLFAALPIIGMGLRHVFVTSGRRDSVELLAQYTDVVGKKVHVVCNEIFGAMKDGAFRRFQGTKTFAEITAHGGEVVALPAMPGRVMADIDWHRISLADAIVRDAGVAGERGTRLGLGERIVASTWVERMTAAFAPLGALA